MRRSDQLAANGIAVLDDEVDVAAGLFSIAMSAGGEMRERTLCAAQVRHAHGRELNATQLLRGKGNRHAQDAVEDAMLAEHMPERFAFAKQANVGLAEWEAILAQSETACRRPDLDRAELGLIGAQVGHQE